ncbi:VanZ family protein [Thalassotalea sp. LPB0316]|uniref:VanZ family protein n=1 Tax=Thalassotalea sp. LPB0316 TaxID=2769490 RepID=UPI0018663C3C|nr:VanZ family protein [Thalassotalea sp. LPB0316]QOL26878.1 VanZ family protein [Thalassotalea sp. LPB0316]
MKSRQQLLFFLFFVLIITGIFISSDTGSSVFQHTQIDTIGHFISFFCLAWFLHAFVKLSLMLLAPTLIVYGFLSEVGQAYLGFRNGEFSDFFADVLGVLFFVLVRWAAMMYGYRLKK